MTIKGYVEQEQAEGLRNDLLRECWFECHWLEVDRAFSQHLADRLAAGKLTTQRLHDIILKRRKVHRLKTGDKVMVERYSFAYALWTKGEIVELGRDRSGVATYKVQLPGKFTRPTETVTVEDQKNRIRTVKEHDDRQADLLAKRDSAYAEKSERNRKRNVDFRLKVAKDIALHLRSKTFVVTYFDETISQESLVETIAESLKGIYAPQY